MEFKFNFRCYAVVVILCLFMFAACGNPTSNNPNENPTNNTWVKFNNLERFAVTMYSDSMRQQAIGEIPALGSATVAATPKITGTPFYPTFHFDLFGIPGISIPYNGPAITTIVEENKTTSVSIPKLESIETNSAYIKIINNSTSSLTLQQGNSERSPLGGGSTIITENITAVFEVTPGPSSAYSIMRSSTPVAFPASLTEFRRGIIYTFTYNGAILALETEFEISNNSIVVRGSDLLAARLAWIAANAASDTTYYLEVYKDENIVPQSLSYSEKSGITIILSGGAVIRTINLSVNGALFTIGPGVTLILDNNITLNGRSGNNNSVVRIERNGTLIMDSDTKITGNTYTSSIFCYGGGVYVGGGTFTMNGGEVSNNTVSSSPSSPDYSGIIHSAGGGVYVSTSGGTFTMNGGRISGNTSYSSFSPSSLFSLYSPYSYGGGVFVGSGIFTMNGGEISGNTASATSSYPSSATPYYNGGGVYVHYSTSTFRMSGGIIYGRTASDGLGNTAQEGSALYKNNGTAQYGMFSGNTFYPSGNLTTTSDTIRIVNGNLQTN